MGMGMGMMLWEWEGAGTLKLIPVHLYLKVVFRNHTLALLPYVTLPSLRRTRVADSDDLKLFLNVDWAKLDHTTAVSLLRHGVVIWRVMHQGRRWTFSTLFLT